MGREHDPRELRAEQSLEHREIDEPASVMSEVAEQATQPRLVVLLLLAAQLAQQPVDAGL